jgi:hypothetical protein
VVIGERQVYLEVNQMVKFGTERVKPADTVGRKRVKDEMRPTPNNESPGNQPSFRKNEIPEQKCREIQKWRVRQEQPMVNPLLDYEPAGLVESDKEIQIGREGKKNSQPNILHLINADYKPGCDLVCQITASDVTGWKHN